MVVEELENRGWWIFCLCCLIRVNDLKGGYKVQVIFRVLLLRSLELCCEFKFVEIPVEEFRLERKYWPVVPSGAINATERVIAEYLINGRITGVSRNCNAIWEMKIVINDYW